LTNANSKKIIKVPALPGTKLTGKVEKPEKCFKQQVVLRSPPQKDVSSKNYCSYQLPVKRSKA